MHSIGNCRAQWFHLRHYEHNMSKWIHLLCSSQYKRLFKVNVEVFNDTKPLTFTVPHLATELTLVWTKNTDSLLKTVLFRDYITYIIAYNYILIYIIIFLLF